MGLFGDKKKELPSLFTEAELSEPLDYNTVLEWLQGLSDADYDTVCKVAQIYRQANKDAAAALGLEDIATTFIHPPEPPEAPEPFLDGDDDLAAAFLEDEPAKKPVDSVAKKPGRKVEVKD